MHYATPPEEEQVASRLKIFVNASSFDYGITFATSLIKI